jgi:DNA repair exonuclease SbcCD nuclease subunit
MSNALRLLHTSDLHIGTDTTADPHRCGWSPCVCPALDVLLMARQWRADVIVVAGDLFDHSRLGDDVVDEVFGALGSAGVPCVVLPGNHDPMDERSLYRRHSALHVIRAAQGETVAPLGSALTVWGRPVVVHSPEYRPLADVPPRPAHGWYVVVAHGHYMSEDNTARRSSPIQRSELDSIDADYVALGHWHQPTPIATKPPTWYSGWPRDAGPPGGALVVDLEPGRAATVTEVGLVRQRGGRHAGTD